MSSSLSDIKHFKAINKVDLTANNFAEASNEDKTKITSLVQSVIIHLQQTSNPKDDELVLPFIEKIKKINDQFTKAGQKTTFAASIHALNLLYSLRTKPDQNEAEVAEKLCLFQNKILSILKSVETKEQLLALGQIVDLCKSLKDKLSSKSAKSDIENRNLEITKLYNVKLIQTDRLYTGLISYEKGEVSLEKEETRIKLASKLTEFITKFIENSKHPLISQNDKAAIYKAVCTIYEEFKQYNDQKLIAPTLEPLCTSLGLPFPKDKHAVRPSSDFDQLKAKFDRPLLSLPPSHNKASVVKKEASKAVNGEIVFSRIQKNISELDARNPKEGIAQIKSDIQKLKKLPSHQHYDFSPLEKMLDLLKDPSPLNISSEEGRFVELLITKDRDRILEEIQVNFSKLEFAQIKSNIQKLKMLPLCENYDFSQFEKLLNSIKNRSPFKISDKDESCLEVLIDSFKSSQKDVLPFYFDLQKASTKSAQSFLLKELKTNAKSIDSLLKSATRAGNGLRDKVVKDRFDKFVEQYPNLNKLKLSPFFPALVNTFEEFTRNIAKPELEKKWAEILTSYDKKTQGKFSQLIGHYSYMDPKKYFEHYIKTLQGQLFTYLHLEQHPLTDANLNSYLKNKLDLAKGRAEGLFAQRYNATFSEKHLWLATNCQNIQVPFNQGDDDNENLGDGVCYANSLYRCSLLMSNPKLDEIKMGSNEKTRYYQQKASVYIDELKRGAASPTTVSKELYKMPASFNLVRSRSDLLKTPDWKDKNQHLVDEMETLSNSSHEEFVLCFDFLDSEEGHAINVQVREEDGIFRFMDDNMGLVRYTTLDEFKKEVKEFFKAFYPKAGQFRFELFKMN